MGAPFLYKKTRFERFAPRDAERRQGCVIDQKETGGGEIKTQSVGSKTSSEGGSSAIKERLFFLEPTWALVPSW